MIVEHFARVPQTADVDSGLFEILIRTRQAARRQIRFAIVALAGDSTRQIKHMELDPRMTQQMSEVPEPF
ncbi:MAG: hypothetical protein WA447_14040 [Candidatus Binatus sp.]|uniref:hypothetical protein n=1 Tax=Candidatus Binatus sp. TaxID=2811406 RepID=UPI003BB01A22